VARGAAQQQALSNQQAAGYQAAAKPLGAGATTAIEGQLANPGFDPTTAAAIRRSGMDTANSAFDAAKFSAAQRAGATGNDAMFYASADKLAQDKAAADATAATNAEVTIGKQKLDSQKQAIQDASQLYATDTRAGVDMYGQAESAMQARPSVLSDIQQGVNTFRTAFPAPKA
jgi:hypothetical protein